MTGAGGGGGRWGAVGVEMKEADHPGGEVPATLWGQKGMSREGKERGGGGLQTLWLRAARQLFWGTEFR